MGNDQLPEGERPAVYWRVYIAKFRVPKGRLNSIPQITFVKFDAVFFQQREEFLLERHCPVMLLLVANVTNEGIQLRHTIHTRRAGRGR